MDIHKQFSRWTKNGVWERVFSFLATDADNEYAMIGNAIAHAISTVPAPKKDGGDQGIGRTRCGLSTKIHAFIDALGNLVAFSLSSGQAHDLAGADNLLPDMQVDLLTAYKACDADGWVISCLADKGKAVVIRPKSTRKIKREYDRDIYKTRHLIESFFARFKQIRANATRYNIPARNYFLAGIHLAAVVIVSNDHKPQVKLRLHVLRLFSFNG